MTPQQFIAKWREAQLAERSAYQQHFCDLCDLLGQPKPAECPATAGKSVGPGTPSADIGF
jgi:hypothetical protein